MHEEGKRPLALPQIMGPGAVFRDLDGDARADLVFVQGSGGSRFAYYRNNGDGTFEDRTVPAGLDLAGWGQAALAADLDSDGDADLVFTFYGESPVLMENAGDGTFRRRPLPPDPEPGVPFGTGLCALDPRQSGVLDVFAASYVDFPRSRIGTSEKVAIRGNWQPRALSPFLAAARPSLYYRQTGPLSFRQDARGFACDNREGKGLAALVLDANSDGRQDFFVANDVSPCALYQSTEDGAFENNAVAAWLAEVGGSMGLALGDYDHDGLLDLFCTRWVAEYHALYRANRKKDGTLYFTNLAEMLGFSILGTNLVGWGTAFLDVTGDGWEDILIVAGHTYVDLTHERLIPQAPVVMVNRGGKKFEPMPAPKGSVLDTPIVGRAAAFADGDNDGAVDVAVTENRGPAHLWRGTPPPGHWLALELTGTISNRDAVGARLEIQAGALKLTRYVTSGDSYFASGSPRVTLRLADETRASVRVIWPGGAVTTAAVEPVDRILRLTEPARADAPAAPGGPDR